MNRTRLSATVLLTLALLAALAPAPSTLAATIPSGGSPTQIYYFDFEQTVNPWMAMTISSQQADLSQNKGNGCSDLLGSTHASLKGVGTTVADPVVAGTWMVTGLPISGGRVRVSLDWSARDEIQCAGCALMAYVGRSMPQGAGAFQTLIAAPLTQNWQNYHYESTLQITGNGTGTVLVALGWTGTDAAIALDCVQVEIGPALNE